MLIRIPNRQRIILRLPAQAVAKPDLKFLVENFEQAVQSFFRTVNQIIEDNPVDAAALQNLVKQAATGRSGC